MLSIIICVFYNNRVQRLQISLGNTVYMNIYLFGDPIIAIKKYG
jgi:hypothetical protein